MQFSILIIDDEPRLRELMGRILQLEGYHILEAGTISEANKILEREEITLVLSDVRLPDGNGVNYCADLKNRFPAIEIIVLTAYGTIADGVKAIKNGAFDYLTKGDDNDRILPLVCKAIDKAQLHSRVIALEKRVGQKYSFDSITGDSPTIKNAITMAKKVAVTDATVLLLGETGTGKEVFAQSIHQESKRKQKPFVAINCSAFSRDILESELFGHKAGAFTGALKDKKGLVEEAQGGTLFLDEIGEMNPELQAKLLRVIECGEYIKVGDTKTQVVNLRFIAATNRDLKEEISTGHFREDLYYRLSVFKITLPALRDRKEDIEQLAYFYLKEFNVKLNAKIKSFSPQLLNKLQHLSWKGNIRELKNLIERLVIMAEGEVLTEQDLPWEYHLETIDESSSLSLANMEKLHISKVWKLCKGNKTEAAHLLNIGLTTLYRKLEEYQIC
ncbi:MAG: two component, sigma54 specific, transcriptional regulator, Fis family [Daejeonella sp.]|nr:two component, sigma54 specific, transcriptional regulator, Fis family [Daejeonella sp.]